MGIQNPFAGLGSGTGRGVHGVPPYDFSDRRAIPKRRLGRKGPVSGTGIRKMPPRPADRRGPRRTRLGRWSANGFYLSSTHIRFLSLNTPHYKEDAFIGKLGISLFFSTDFLRVEPSAPSDRAPPGPSHPEAWAPGSCATLWGSIRRRRASRLGLCSSNGPLSLRLSFMWVSNDSRPGWR